MITDEQLVELPIEPEAAFVAFEKIVRAGLKTAEDREGPEDVTADFVRAEYMNLVYAAAESYGITELRGLSLSDGTVGSPMFRNDFKSFMNIVDAYNIRHRIKAAQRSKAGSVRLEDTLKTKIHHFILQIKDIISQSDLPDDRRDTLLDKLNRFAAEVDKSRTALQTGMEVYIAVCDAVGKGFDKLEPARKWIDSIAAVLGGAKEVEDAANVRLPKRPDTKRLPGYAEEPTKAPDEEDIPF